MDFTAILQGLIVARDYIEIGLAILALVGVPLGSARGAIATVNEIMANGSTMTNDQALQKASDLMGKWFPFLPELVRKWIIQTAFNSMKAKAEALKKGNK